MKIGLYFGTFNPIHIGHLAIANHMAEHSDLDKIWMVITPHNPFKKKSSLLDNYERYHMVDLALASYDKIVPSKIEFDLPQPNYTVNTLAYLEEKHPEHSFCLIMGEDNLKGLHKWKNYEVILDRYAVYVYPRISKGEVEHQFKNHPKIHPVAAPIMEISSTAIRNGIKNNINIRPYLSAAVWEEIDQAGYYK